MNNFKQFYFKESKDNVYKNEHGFIKYMIVDEDYRYEFLDSSESNYNEFWNQRNVWYTINEIRVYDKFKGYGKTLLKEWINSLSKNVGVVLNATPLDFEVSYEYLLQWYIKFGFKQISENNMSLYYLK